MRSIVFFNNKGGVGKTTLACNIASHLALAFRLRVLLVDCDPQCNSTQLLLDEDECLKIYGDDGSSSAHTLLDVLKPIREGGAEINKDAAPLLSSTNRFAVDLLCGHPRVAMLEDEFSTNWTNILAGKIGGFRISSWTRELNRTLADKYDAIVYDVGPSLGALNRTILLGCDYFVTPMGCDIFSIMGIKNIRNWIDTIVRDYTDGFKKCARDDSQSLKDHSIPEALSISKGFAGYTVQQYITKSKEGVRRATKAYEQILADIPSVISAELGAYFANGVDARGAKLGDVPHMYSLVPLAQAANAPIIGLSGSDRLVGAQYQQQATYIKIIQRAASALVRNVGLRAAP